MGDLRPGDHVIGGDGRPCRVTWVSPIWEGRDCYRVTTGDGEEITADAAHEWVARLDRRRSPRVVETTDLARPRSKAAQITAPAAGLDLPPADLPLDPYVLGAWLGDGSTGAAYITSHPDDVEVRDRITAAGYPLTHRGRCLYSMTPAGWGNRGSTPSPAKAALRAAGVLHRKHIPAVYLRASREQRLALLQGLVDTDGHVTVKGQVEYTSTSRELAEAVRELVYTLGAKAVLTTDRATLNGRDCGPRYRVRFYLADAAHLPRKAGRCKDSSVANVRYVKAEPCTSQPTMCIEVDSPDHTFLAGRTMLPTHNSQRAARRFPEWVLARNPDTRVAIASYDYSTARRWGRAIRDDLEQHRDVLRLSVRGDVSAQDEWELAGHRGGVITTGVGGGLTGRAVDLMVIDDPVKNREQAESRVYRDRVWDWWTDVVSTRLAGSPVVLIMTRWHHDDLAGRLLAAEDGHRWRVLNIPAQSLGDGDPLGRAEGEYLQSTRGRTRKQWEQIKVQAGHRTWGALYQGAPTVEEGSLFPTSGWPRYTRPLWAVREDGARVIPDADRADVEVVQSWDFTFKGTDSADYVVGQVWVRRGPDAYLVDMVRERAGFARSVEMIRDLSARWPQAHRKLVEDKANGPAIIDSLRQQLGGVVPVEPYGSKLARAHAVTPWTDAGNVHLPDPGAVDGTGWVVSLTDEARDFPHGQHDDTVDAMTQALDHLMATRVLDDTIHTDFDAAADVDTLTQWETNPYDW